jgi:predicted DNA-binding transcriptional regulator AlpA
MISGVTRHLVGVGEIAKMLGVSRQRVDQIAASAEFPEPEVELMAGRVWIRSAVEAWVRNHPDRRPGRPPTKSG